jgi:hypothetical protein
MKDKFGKKLQVGDTVRFTSLGLRDSGRIVGFNQGHQFAIIKRDAIRWDESWCYSEQIERCN